MTASSVFLRLIPICLVLCALTSNTQARMHGAIALTAAIGAAKAKEKDSLPRPATKQANPDTDSNALPFAERQKDAKKLSNTVNDLVEADDLVQNLGKIVPKLHHVFNGVGEKSAKKLLESFDDSHQNLIGAVRKLYDRNPPLSTDQLKSAMNSSDIWTRYVAHLEAQRQVQSDPVAGVFSGYRPMVALNSAKDLRKARDHQTMAKSIANHITSLHGGDGSQLRALKKRVQKIDPQGQDRRLREQMLLAIDLAMGNNPQTSGKSKHFLSAFKTSYERHSNLAKRFYSQVQNAVRPDGKGNYKVVNHQIVGKWRRHYGLTNKQGVEQNGRAIWDWISQQGKLAKTDAQKEHLNRVAAVLFGRIDSRGTHKSISKQFAFTHSGSPYHSTFNLGQSLFKAQTQKSFVARATSSKFLSHLSNKGRYSTPLVHTIVPTVLPPLATPAPRIAKHTPSQKKSSLPTPVRETNLKSSNNQSTKQATKTSDTKEKKLATPSNLSLLTINMNVQVDNRKQGGNSINIGTANSGNIGSTTSASVSGTETTVSTPLRRRTNPTVTIATPSTNLISLLGLLPQSPGARPIPIVRQWMLRYLNSPNRP